MRTDYHVHFYIRKTKVNKIGLVPIYLRLVVKKRRTEYSISRSVDPKLWNTKIEKVMGNNREAQEINNHIANLRHKLNRIHQTFVDNDIEISAQSLMYNLRGGPKTKSKLVLTVFKEHNEKMDTLIEKDITASTASRYWTCSRDFFSFLYRAHSILQHSNRL